MKGPTAQYWKAQHNTAASVRFGEGESPLISNPLEMLIPSLPENFRCLSSAWLSNSFCMLLLGRVHVPHTPKGSVDKTVEFFCFDSGDQIPGLALNDIPSVASHTTA